MRGKVNSASVWRINPKIWLVMSVFLFGIGLQAQAGSIVGWGHNDAGQSSPPAGTDFVAVAPGYWHSLSLKRDGSIVA